jgi:magnesium transporter
VDRAAAIMRRLPAARRDRLLEECDADRRSHLRALLAYPENTAGALADPLALALTEDITVREAQRQMRSSERHLFYHVFIIARDRTLRGTLAMQELMGARPRQPLSAVMQRDVVAIDAFTPLATVAVHPAWREFDALPVIDTDRRLIGAIRHRMIRQLAHEPTHAVMDTIVGLSELYWAGLSSMLTSLVPPRSETGESQDVA